MVENTSIVPSRRKELTKRQAIVLMVIGGLMLAQAFFIHTEVGTRSHLIKVIAAFIGFGVLMVGVTLRPGKPSGEEKQH
jgi:hypothetical protein